MSANSFPSSAEPQMISNREVVGKDNTSGKGDFYPAPNGVAGWSWGAFLLAPIWAARHKRWISFFLLVLPVIAAVAASGDIRNMERRWLALLLIFAPVISFVCAINVGRRARLWAWHHIYWESLADFKHTQRRWTLIAFSLYALTISAVGAVRYPEIQREAARRKFEATSEANRKELVLNGRRAVDDAVYTAKEVSVAVGGYILSHRAFPQSITEAGFDVPLPDYIKSMEIDQKTGLIKVTMNIAPFIGQAFYLAPRYEGDKEILWRCLRGDFSTLDIQRECRYDTTDTFSIRRK